MKKVINIFKKVLLVCGILFVILIGAVCCDSESVNEQPVESKQETTIEKQNDNNTNASNTTNNLQSKKKDVQSDKSEEWDYTGRVFIVDIDGSTLGYAYDSFNGVYELGERYAPEISMGVPYVAWMGDNENELFIVATANSDGSWSIDESEFDKIPEGWQWFLDVAINKANSYA